MYRKIFLDAPNLGALEKEYLNKAIDANFVSTAGPFVPEFERRFAEYLGVRACVSTQSGTAALHMALYELGITTGDEVIVPALTFIATANPIFYVGATPVIVDVDPETWLLDPEEVEKAITPRTKAVIPVHLYGNPCNMDEIMRIAEKHGLYVIEDATESLGATYRGKFTGTFGHFGCFSFNGNKIMTTGGGGMIATNNERQAEHIRFLANQARDTERGYYHPEMGFNYRMTNLEAALGLAQLQRLSGFLEKKRDFFKLYQKGLAKMETTIRFQKEEGPSNSAAWLNSVWIDTKKTGFTISEIQEKLRKESVPTRRIFQPLVDFPPYQQFRLRQYKNAYDIYEHGLNLPSSTLNDIEDIEHVFSRILKILGDNYSFK